jgi:hypothetical protein
MRAVEMLAAGSTSRTPAQHKCTISEAERADKTAATLLLVPGCTTAEEARQQDHTIKVVPRLTACAVPR